MFSIAAVKITITLKAYDRNLLHWSSIAQRPSEVQLESLLRVSQGQNQGVGQAGLWSGGSGEGPLSRLTRRWKNSAPCTCRTKVLVSLLAGGQRSSPSFVWLMGLSICKASGAPLNTSVLQTSLSSSLKGLCDYIGPNRITPHHAFVLKSFG